MTGRIICKKCGKLVEELPTDARGFKNGAIREYNRFYKELNTKKQKVMTL